MPDVIKPIEPGKPGTLGPTVVIGTISTQPVTKGGELLALVLQLDALIYQIKARLERVI